MVAALLSALTFGVWGGGPAPLDRPLEWVLAGVGQGGRTLIVQPGIYGGCDQGTPDVAVDADASAIVVTVTVKTVQGPDIACPAIARYAEARRVRLAQPVAGRPVSGDRQARRPGAALDFRAPSAGRPRVPRVVGLAGADARQVLCAWRIRATPAGRGRVVAQHPRAGAHYTVPRVAAPTSCAKLPAHPSARLTLR